MQKSKVNSALNYILCISMLSLFMTLFLPLTHAENPQLRKGSTLFYRALRGSKHFSAYQKSDILDRILKLNQTTLIFQRDFAGMGSSGKLEIKIIYRDGVPTYADYLTALIYLPPECIAKSLQGNLEWTTQINTRPPMVTVTNKTIETLNFPVEAGTFQSINITLSLIGWETGTLTLIYDINSGILIYECWVTDYGEIITQELIAVAYTPKTQLTILELILPAATLITPVAIAIHQTRKTLQKRPRKNEQQPKEAALKSGFPKKSFYVILAGALLNLCSVIMPWSQFAGSQTYLPLSLPLLFSETAGFYTSTPIFVIISLTAHIAAILAWLSIAMYIYTNKKLTPQLATLTSSILAFASALIFIQTGWTPSWGLPLIIIGGILAIAGIASANIKVEIVIEETENAVA